MGESKIRKCIICGRLITASRRYAYCSDECAGYASKEPGRKSKQYRNELIRIAAEAREHGMSYGQYVGIYEYQKGMKI